MKSILPHNYKMTYIVLELNVIFVPFRESEDVRFLLVHKDFLV